ncbi:hypothetical protein DCAR_0105209 [Daucus carota subsp. sativus]|uniref:Uncharacterized protein n=1 Tax=Daucus carota subsp. sativus TaxID=79200 RepID=A0AAF0W9W9_DAUCS|nr:hypothetical protein DCAR_0105209 [Daucus carota subsp. sativus]
MYILSSAKMVLLKRLCLLFFLVVISASLLSTAYTDLSQVDIPSYAGQGLPKYVDFEKKKSVEAHTNDQTRISIHKRLLRVKTNDYGSYDPAPTFHKPKFKQIPN